jgi:cell division protease FtsH
MMMMLPMMMMLMPMLCAVNGYMLPRLNHHPFALLATRGDKYPISRNYYEESLKRLNSYNGTMRDLELLGMAGSWIEKTGESIIIIHHREVTTNHTDGDDGCDGDDGGDDGEFERDDSDDDAKEKRRDQEKKNHRNFAFKKLLERYNKNDDNDTEPDRLSKSDNFEVMVGGTGITFADIGGFDGVKEELLQCADMLKNWQHYAQYSVRTPKGLVLEGPPGNGKTMLARGFAGEADVGMIAVSGAEFQDKYIGVGSSKVRELFTLASHNRPCVVFIDEIDALGRRRSDGEGGGGGGAERDNTLNQLLVEMDGFRNNSGIFVIGATNRADLLDPALMRPGRIDKRIYVGMPDLVARRFIVDIHIKGKPNRLSKEQIEEIVSMTGGFSGAQIENLLNEAMLYALKGKRDEFDWSDIENSYNSVLGGSQSEAHVISDDMLERICVHEIGHSLVGIFCKNHPLLKKVVINLKSPRNPGMTIFEEDGGMLSTRESLFERVAIMYGGQIAEKLIYGEGMVSTGSTSDCAEARKLAQKMVIEYGMGVRYGGVSEKSKEKIDEDVGRIMFEAYSLAYSILQNNRDSIVSGSAILKREFTITRKDLMSYLML